MNELQIFTHDKFGKIRTVDVDGKQGLVAADVARALGYKDPGKAIRQHCRWGVKRPIPHPQSPDKEILVSVIFKSDLYRLAANSELPGAEEFESWIFDEVLVSIDEHGGYLTPAKIEEVLLNPDTIIRLATDLKNEREKSKALEVKIETDRPKVLFADAVEISGDSILIRELAKYLKQDGQDIGEKRLYKWLREKGFLIKQKGSDYNLPTQRSVELELFEVKKRIILRPDGTSKPKTTAYVTGKGQIYFINKFRLMKENSA